MNPLSDLISLDAYNKIIMIGILDLNSVGSYFFSVEGSVSSYKVAEGYY